MAWISVKDSLPKEWDFVLVWGHISGNDYPDDIHMARMTQEEGEEARWTRADSDGWRMEVTHWQPLPEGPGSAEAVASIKQVLAGDPVIDILQEWGEGRLDREPILQPDKPDHKNDQHPQFTCGDGVSAEPSNKDPIEEF